MVNSYTWVPTKTTTHDVDIVFMTIPAKMICDAKHYIEEAKKPKRKRKGAKQSPKGFPLTSLSPELIMNLMDHLTVTENACLALTCKFLASIAVSHNSLTVKASSAVLRHVHDPSQEAWHLEVTRFFKLLKKGWVPPGLSYCYRCSMFRPRTPEFWMDYGKKKAVKYGGLAGKCWAEMLANGSNMVGERGFFSTWTITCPACALENPGRGFYR